MQQNNEFRCNVSTVFCRQLKDSVSDNSFTAQCYVMATVLNGVREVRTTLELFYI